MKTQISLLKTVGLLVCGSLLLIMFTACARRCLALASSC